jgi:Ca-activated chloride channel homolog
MPTRMIFWALILAGLVAGLSGLASPAFRAAAQDAKFRVEVQLVQLDVAVTDGKGAYVTGLKPGDFSITEDRVAQKIAVFGEGNQQARRVGDLAAQTPPQVTPAAPPPDAAAQSALSGSAQPVSAEPTPSQSAASQLISPLAGASVFILFDTSNYMYRGFVFAQDAIADFVRALDGPDRVALYAYSRDLYRATPLTPDRLQVLRGVRSTTAGDDAALYNSLLITLKDAALYSGRRAVVVFSNGPDNASMVPPEDIRELAQSEAVPIYMISTRDARIEPVSTAVFERMSASTGGQAYFARNWQDEQKAFAGIRDDLAHTYAIYYYPEVNPNSGWRAITVKLVGPQMEKYRVRTRSGYRPRPARQVDEVGAQ